MRRLAIVPLLVLAAGVVSTTQGTPAAAATPSCFGAPATIVSSTPGETVHGTGGRDVIFTDFDGAAQTIYAYGGSDLICAGYGDTVFAGSGADSVTAYDVAAVYGESGDDFLQTFSTDLTSGGSGRDSFDVVAGGTCDGGSGSDAFGAHDGCATVRSIP